MTPTIIFGRETVKSLNLHVHAAFRVGDVPRIKHICALLLLADQRPAPVVAERLGSGRSTVSAWLNAFLVDRFASVQRRKPAGRQLGRTPGGFAAPGDPGGGGPEAAGYASGCWHSALLHAVSVGEFGVLYPVHDVSELLRNLGFAYQKPRFVSDHLNDEERQQLLRQTG